MSLRYERHRALIEAGVQKVVVTRFTWKRMQGLLAEATNTLNTVKEGNSSIDAVNEAAELVRSYVELNGLFFYEVVRMPRKFCLQEKKGFGRRVKMKKLYYTNGDGVKRFKGCEYKIYEAPMLFPPR